MNAPARNLDAVELGELGESLGFLVRLAQLRLFDGFFARMAAEGLKPGEFTALWCVALNPGIRQGTLARRLRIKPAHMTKLVGRMVEAGHLERQVPPEDRRTVHLLATPAGEALVERHRAAFLDLHRTERAGLTEAEVERLLPLLRKLAGLEDTA